MLARGLFRGLLRDACVSGAAKRVGAARWLSRDDDAVMGRGNAASGECGDADDDELSAGQFPEIFQGHAVSSSVSRPP